MKSRSSSDVSAVLGTPVNRDARLVALARSILDAARGEWGDRFVTEPNARRNDPAQLYTETHYSLAAVLLSFLSGKDRRYLDLAASRLRLWDAGNGPMTFFNAMAVCLIAIVVRRSGTAHAGLDEIVTALLSRAHEHRHVALEQFCGNNAYLQQVAVDTVLLPLARGRQVTPAGVDLLVGEFHKYRTREGFFFDLPRWGTEQERLSPPTYIMKMLFLAGICHELLGSLALSQLFQTGMAGVLPLFTRDGHVSYFGRTDNSPFAAGLTVFNLRKASQEAAGDDLSYDRACVDAERYYASFPRTSTGMLQSNRFADPASLAELNWSRDVYSYDGQYSLASCAYALLGCHWYPRPGESWPPERSTESVTADSTDLGLARMCAGRAELVVRTGCEATGWDRRYLGPTILRYQVDDRLLVGAISTTISTDAGLQPTAPSNRIRRAYEILRDKFMKGIEQLDGTAVGFLPVLRQGPVDYLPYTVVDVASSPSRIRVRYRMLQLHVRGYRPCLSEVLQVLHNKIKVLGPKHYMRPAMKPVDSIELLRTVYLDRERCRIEDTLTGDLAGKTLLFSIRHLPGASVRVRGLEERRSATGWGSDGRQALMLYERLATGSEIRYECDIELAGRQPS